MTLPPDAIQKIETNEAAAYSSLMQTGSRLHGEAAFQVRPLGSATVLVSPAIGKPGVFNRVLGLGLREPATLELVDEIVRSYREAGCGCAIELVPSIVTPELREWLRSRRIRRGAAAAVVHLKPHAMARTQGRVQVARAGAGERDLVAAICAQVFGMPPPVRQILAALEEADGWRYWLARLDGNPVAGALSFIRGNQCWFGWDATLPEFRGLRAKSSIDDVRTTDAFEAGCTLVTSETAISTQERPDPSFRSFQRVGFELAYERATYFCT